MGKLRECVCVSGEDGVVGGGVGKRRGDRGVEVECEEGSVGQTGEDLLEHMLSSGLRMP